MPETERKQFVLIKTTPDDVLFTLRSVENPQLTRQIYLTSTHAKQPLPVEWALSILADSVLYTMYKRGLFTFDANDELAALAYERGYLFDNKLDFTPASPQDDALILSILKVGNRTKIEETIKKFGKERVKSVAVANLANLTQNVISVLEKMFGVQLTVDGVSELEMAQENQ